jgi:hypothetical protein
MQQFHLLYFEWKNSMAVCGGAGVDGVRATDLGQVCRLQHLDFCMHEEFF